MGGTDYYRIRQAGGLLVKRAYGNATKIRGWDDAPGIKLVHTGTGKNAADIALAIEAVDLSHSGHVQNFVLVSSDGDFSHLAAFLRERGHQVMGVGEEKAPLGFRNSCTSWRKIEVKGAKDQRSKEVVQPIDLDKRVWTEISRHQSGILITQAEQILNCRLGVMLSDFNEKSWRKYFEKRSDSFKISGEAQQTRITAR